MNAAWQCAVCETVNHGGRVCSACGATMTRRSTVSTAVRARVAPPVPLPPVSVPLPPPVQRAINRTPVPEEEEEEWEEYEDSSFELMPLPGGCLFNIGPRRTYW